ncbi:MAG: HEAT repeat domain-containing protein, partial [Planctomycetes bacterium]|nr:HEAT repeat domain-containing protein [Planctomycetota bacterium]
MARRNYLEETNMRMQAVRGLLLFAVLLIGMVRLLPAADGETERDKNLRGLLSQAVDEFEQGRWVSAKSALDMLYAENPSSKECWLLREAFGDKIIRKMAMWMKEGETLGQGAMELLVRAQEEEQKQIFDPENIRRIVEDVVVVNKEGEYPIRQLKEIHIVGSFAVPALVSHLKAGKDEVARTNASYILMNLGPQAVIPLVECLNSDDAILLQHTCFILAQIRPEDQRALPALMRLYEKEGNLPAVREAAKQAVEAISGSTIDKVPSSEVLYYKEANRLYQGGSIIDAEMEDLKGALWTWTDKGLVNAIVPIYQLDDLMAQELIYDGMEVAKDPSSFEILLASSFIKQAVENDEMEMVLERKAVENPEITKQQTEFKVWTQLLAKNKKLARIVGPDLMVSVFDKAMLDGQVTVATACLKAFQASAGDKGWAMVSGWAPAVSKVADKAEDSKAAAPASVDSHPFIAALDHPDWRIRVAAANCLVRIGFPSSDPAYKRLSAILAEGARQNSRYVVLIISNDANVRETMAKKLEAEKLDGKEIVNNILVMTAPSGRDGVNLAKQYPTKDCIIIDREVNEFARLHERRALYEHTSGSELPLTIVTSRHRVDEIKAQFPDTMWTVHVRTNITADKENLYEQLHLLQRYRDEKQVVAILTQDDAKERRRIQQFLQLEAERRGRPTRQSELLKLMSESKDKRLYDIFPTRNIFVNVYVDDDLSGYNAMRTLQEIRRSPSTAKVPVALLTTAEDKKNAAAEFERFMDDKAN